MDKELFECGADVDVEALMARIREGVGRPKGSTREYALNPLQSTKLQSTTDESLAREIQHSSALAQIVNQIPLKETGFKRSLEHKAKKFLKWLVHWNTKGQADFNVSVTRSLEIIAQQLQNSQMNFVAVGGRLSDELRQTSEINLSTREEITRLSAGFEDITKTVAEIAYELRDGLERSRKETNSRASEQANHLLTELKKIERVAEAIGLEYSGLEQRVNQEIEDVRAKAQAIVVELAELEGKSDKEVSEIRQRAQTDFASIDARLQEVERDARAGQQQSREQMSAFEQTVSRGIDELKIRLLGAELSLKAALERDDSLSPVSNEGERIASRVRRIEHKENGQRRNGTTSHRDGALEWPFDYFLFESRFRGSISEIKRRQSLYVEPFIGKKNVVDLGCGRGEFVELLSENGINVTGVDINKDMVEFCRDRGLRVVQADIFDYLANLPEKVDGIFLSQVVEHLAPGEILELVGLCAQSLEAGGVIVAETVNTNCPVALSNFYLDPTHVRPVPAEMLHFVFEQASFEVQYLRFSSPVGDNDVSEVLDLRSRLTPEVILYQDYAVVAVAH